MLGMLANWDLVGGILLGNVLLAFWFEGQFHETKL